MKAADGLLSVGEQQWTVGGKGLAKKWKQVPLTVSLLATKAEAKTATERLREARERQVAEQAAVQQRCKDAAQTQAANTSELRVGGFPSTRAHSATLGVALDLGSFNGLYSHADGDDTPEGFPVWRCDSRSAVAADDPEPPASAGGEMGDDARADSGERFLYVCAGRGFQWVFNSALRLRVASNGPAEGSGCS